MRPKQTFQAVPPLKYVPAAAVSSVRPAAGHRPAAELTTQQIANRLEGTVMQQVLSVHTPQPPVQPSLEHTEKYIRQSLVEVVGRASGELMGSGFVVKSGSGRLYAVVSYHVVGRAGNTVALRMYDAAGKPVLYGGAVVSAAGSFGINAPDAAIIELPASAALHVRPLQVAHSLPQEGSELVVWGSPYAANGFARVDELTVKRAQNIKIVMDSPDVSEEFNGLCGSPVLDAQGKVAGIYSGHAPEQGFVFAVNARQALEWLIGNYEKGMVPYTVFKIYGRQVLQVQAEETVGWVYHFDPNGTLLHKVYLPKYPGAFDPEHAERLFPDVRHGDFLEFELVKHRQIQKTISVEIS